MQPIAPKVGDTVTWLSKHRDTARRGVVVKLEGRRAVVEVRRINQWTLDETSKAYRPLIKDLRVAARAICRPREGLDTSA